MTTKLSPAQQKVIDLLNDGVGIRRNFMGRFWYYQPDQESWGTLTISCRTVSALLRRKLISEIPYEYQSRRYFKLQLGR